MLPLLIENNNINNKVETFTKQSGKVYERLIVYASHSERILFLL